MTYTSAIGLGRALSVLSAASRALREAQATQGVLLNARSLAAALPLGVRGQGGLVDLWFQSQEGQLGSESRAGLEAYLLTLPAFSRVRAWRRELQTGACIANHEEVIKPLVAAIEARPDEARAVLADPNGSWTQFLGRPALAAA